MTELRELKAQLETAIAKRNAEWIPGRAPRPWRMAVVEVENLSKQIHDLEAKNAPKSVMPEWMADQLDVDWDED